jgi:hypothetical protein
MAIHTGSVIKGGLVAGLIINIGETILVRARQSAPA